MSTFTARNGNDTVVVKNTFLEVSEFKDIASPLRRCNSDSCLQIRSEIPEYRPGAKKTSEETAILFNKSFPGADTVRFLSTEWFQRAFKFILGQGFPDDVPDLYIRKLCPWIVQPAVFEKEASKAALSPSCHFRIVKSTPKQRNIGFAFWLVPFDSSCDIRHLDSSKMGNVCTHFKLPFLTAEEWSRFARCLAGNGLKELLPVTGDFELSLAIYVKYVLQQGTGPLSLFCDQKLWMIMRFVYHCRKGGPLCPCPPVRQVDGKLQWNEAFKSPEAQYLNQLHQRILLPAVHTDPQATIAGAVRQEREKRRCLEIVGFILAWMRATEKGWLKKTHLKPFLTRLADFLQSCPSRSFKSMYEEMMHLFETSRSFEFDGQKQSYPHGRDGLFNHLFQFHETFRKHFKMSGLRGQEVVERQQQFGMSETERDIIEVNIDQGTDLIKRNLQAKMEKEKGQAASRKQNVYRPDKHSISEHEIPQATMEHYQYSVYQQQAYFMYQQQEFFMYQQQVYTQPAPGCQPQRAPPVTQPRPVGLQPRPKGLQPPRQ